MTIKLRPYLWKNKEDKDGKCPIAIAIRANSAETYYNTGIKVSAKNWKDGVILKGEPNYDILNATLQDMVVTTQREVLTRQLQKEVLTIDDVKKLLRPDSAKGAEYFKFAMGIIDKKEANTKKRYAIEVEKMKEYIHGKPLPDKKHGDDRIKILDAVKIHFGEITPKWLTGYYDHLIAKNNHNTTINAFKVIRHVFNEAREQHVTKMYPFDKWEYPKYKAPEREYLTVEECDKLFNLLHTNEINEEEKLVVAFALVEAFSGIRVSDWGKFRIEKTGAHYDMVFTTTKTRTPVRLPVDLMPSLERILKYISDNNLKWNKTGERANMALKNVARVAKIEKTLTTHIFRHTFATQSLAIGMSKEDLAVAMGIQLNQVDTYAKIAPHKLRSSLKRIGGGI